jgi:hypothetical protein
MKKYAMRIHFSVAGGHTHMAIFTGPEGLTLGKAGTLTMTNEEFEAWRRNQIKLEFVQHGKEETPAARQDKEAQSGGFDGYGK